MRSLATDSSSGQGGSGESKSLWGRFISFFQFYHDRPSYVNWADREGKGKGYRYPSPASTSEGVSVPHVSNFDQLYDTKYYTRGAREQMQDTILIGERAQKLRLPEVGQKLIRDGSPGSGNPDVLRYDPTGLRAGVTATWDAQLEELEKHAPTHLPKPWWEYEGLDVAAEHEKKEIPPVPGKRRIYEGQEKLREQNW